ncbi:hypothetical protein JMJ77_0012678 [Colletotrichum scovillei]|uniref:Uncharacterized protein n=1 Tax=Colletotrichum scovillei TaxID=1209932 RepID=A0A9P7R5K4_9PEZI|nr:hypothetical protein JMJ77_0012678 [Colletotrichum scovillei]KAG7068957.1 hypothetical protein JMJ76_0002637 [Colletotrichum scovillei]KAG7072910.1 hypothetical protein JMJ78_0013895 [Colletotrichum scovillei]
MEQGTTARYRARLGYLSPGSSGTYPHSVHDTEQKHNNPSRLDRVCCSTLGTLPSYTVLFKFANLFTVPFLKDRAAAFHFLYTTFFVPSLAALLNSSDALDDLSPFKHPFPESAITASLPPAQDTYLSLGLSAVIN